MTHVREGIDLIDRRLFRAGLVLVVGAISLPVPVLAGRWSTPLRPQRVATYSDFVLEARGLTPDRIRASAIRQTAQPAITRAVGVIGHFSYRVELVAMRGKRRALVLERTLDDLTPLGSTRGGADAAQRKRDHARAMATLGEVGRRIEKDLPEATFEVATRPPKGRRWFNRALQRFPVLAVSLSYRETLPSSPEAIVAAEAVGTPSRWFFGDIPE